MSIDPRLWERYNPWMDIKDKKSMYGGIVTNSKNCIRIIHQCTKNECMLDWNWKLFVTVPGMGTGWRKDEIQEVAGNVWDPGHWPCKVVLAEIWSSHDKLKVSCCFCLS